VHLTTFACSSRRGPLIFMDYLMWRVHDILRESMLCKPFCTPCMHIESTIASICSSEYSVQLKLSAGPLQTWLRGLELSNVCDADMSLYSWLTLSSVLQCCVSHTKQRGGCLPEAPSHGPLCLLPCGRHVSYAFNGQMLKNERLVVECNWRV
jgi:hypothetical protein